MAYWGTGSNPIDLKATWDHNPLRYQGAESAEPLYMNGQRPAQIMRPYATGLRLLGGARNAGLASSSYTTYLPHFSSQILPGGGPSAARITASQGRHNGGSETVFIPGVYVPAVR